MKTLNGELVLAVLIDGLNRTLEQKGSCLRYVEESRESALGFLTINYKLIVHDPYIEPKYMPSPITPLRFQDEVREYFRQFNIFDTGYSNTCDVLRFCCEDSVVKWRNKSKEK